MEQDGSDPALKIPKRYITLQKLLDHLDRRCPVDQPEIDRCVIERWIIIISVKHLFVIFSSLFFL